MKRALLFYFLLLTGILNAQISQVQFNQYSTFTTLLENENNAYIVFQNLGMATTMVEYSQNNGATWIPIIANFPSSGSGLDFYQWAIPASLTGPITVRVSDASNSALSAQSNATVSAPQPAFIDITSPSGGEVFTALSEITIKYNAHKIPLNSSFKEEFKIEVSTNGGTSWTTIANPATGRQFTWQLPYNFNGNVKFRVSAYTNSSISDETNGSLSVQPNTIVNSAYRFAQNDVHGTVLAMTKDQSGNIYVAGDFDYVDTIVANNVAMWNPSTGKWSKLGDGLDSAVKTIAVYNDEVYVGGIFEFNSATRSGVGIKKYNLSSGIWTNVADITQETSCTIACPIPYVSMISFDNSYMYVAGFYKTIAGNAFTHAAKKNLSTGAWSKVGHYNYPISYSIENAIEYFYVDGNHGYYISENDSLIRLDLSSNAILEKYSMKINNVNHPAMMDALKIGDTLIYVARYFSSDYYIYKYNTVTKQFGTKIKINSGGGFAYPRLAYWNNTLICAFGTLGTYNSTSTNMVGLPSNISLVFTGIPKCLLVTNDNRLLIGGTISVANQASTNYTRKPISGICQLDVNNNFGKLSSTTYFGLYTSSTGIVKNGNHLYVAAGQAYIGASFENSFGNIRTSNGKSFKGVAQWNADSLKWTSLGTGLHKGAGGPLSPAGEANQIIDKDTLLLVGGYFDTGDSGTVVDIWTSQLGPRYNTLNNVGIWYKGSKKWGKMGSGTNGRVNAMILAGEDVYVGGMFTTAGGLSTQLAKYNLLTKQWTSLNVTDEIRLMVSDGNAIYIAAQFIDELPGAVTCNGLAKYDIASGTWSNISGSYSDHSISAMAINGNYIYIANYDGHALVKFDKTNNTYTVLHSPLLTSNGMGGTINSLDVSGDYLYIGGLFDEIGGVPTKNFAVMNITTGTFSNARRASLNIQGANGEVKYVKAYGNEIYATGAFSVLNKKFSGGLGIVAVPGSVTSISNFLNTNSSEKEMLCYPNPATSEIMIREEFKSYREVKIMNSLGQTVQTFSLESGNIVSVEGIEPGLYHLILSGEKGQRTQKLIIEK